MDREEIRIFTARSVAAGVAVGAGAAFALHDLAGASARLAALAGLPAGVVAAVLPVTWRDGRFGWLMQSSASRRYPGFLVLLLVSLLIIAPSALVDRAFADDALGAGDERALELLFFLTGFATFVLGGVTATLEHLEKDEHEADPGWRRATPPPADRRR